MDRFQSKLRTERDENTKLFTGWKMAHTTLNPEKQSESDSLEKRQYLAHAKCIEIKDPVDSQGETTYLLETLPKQVLLYESESIQFVKTDNPCRLTMQMRI